jgi:hypothetical protein
MVTQDSGFRNVVDQLQSRRRGLGEAEARNCPKPKALTTTTEDRRVMPFERWCRQMVAESHEGQKMFR